MQLWVKFKKILYVGFRATLKFSTIKGGSEPYVQNIMKTLLKVASYLSYQNSIIRQKFTALF